MGNEYKQLTLIGDVSRILKTEAPPSDRYSIRTIKPEDKEPLAKLYHDSYTRDLVTDMDDATEEIEQTFRGEFGTLDPDASLVVVEGERLVGSILTVEEAPWPGTPAGPFIIDLFIHPNARRRGLAHVMISEAALALSRKGKETAALRVLSSNTGALRLYEKLGFKPAPEKET
jgi:ribosomal protein S18 acetylase RimI-like enzyme